jgi:hypothetical protein
MISRGTLVWLSLAVAAGVGLFHVSYRVQSLEEELARVNRDILHEQESIHVLRAEWSYLNEPQRLAELSRRHLALAPLSATQMMRIEDLPLRLPPLIAETAPLPDPGPSIQPSSITTPAEAPPRPTEPPPASIADLIERTSQQP